MDFGPCNGFLRDAAWVTMVSDTAVRVRRCDVEALDIVSV